MRPIGMKQIFNSVSIAAVALLSLCQVQLTFAQLNTFEAGQPIRASEMNHNFEVVQEQIEEISTSSITDAGCSATQQENSVLIECSDGTSGVIAGAGTVIVYPEGQIGEAPDISYNTGDIVVKDASDTVLAKTSENPSCADIPILITESQFPTAALTNLDLTQEVVFSSSCLPQVFFLSDDCSGIPFVETEYYLIDLPESFYIPNPERGRESILFSSKRRSAGINNLSYNQALACEPGQYVATAMPSIPYTPAPEILNAVYPVRLEQLP